MSPAPGDRVQRFVGDQLRFLLKDGEGARTGWQARLRTNLGRVEVLRREILQAHTQGLPLGGESWRDVPMTETADGWALELPLAEVGSFKAKAYLVDPRGWQHWPQGPDVSIAVHPDRYRTANILYCAFPRLFGDTRIAVSTRDAKRTRLLRALDEVGYTAIPPSGKLRDLTSQLPHIVGTLGCRVIHLLPIHPTPTTFARFGRFGSPYAALDLTAIDPALVVFDKRTTGIDQFCELAYETHLRGARLFLDIVINHTGWGSVLQENHPEWFRREADGKFASPGAQCGDSWVTWEDLVELKHQNVALWDELAQMFLTWCRRGVDGFRCDAGYKVPVPAWQYIIARVQQEYPETIFFLEGLGGPWEATESLLTTGGMQWAYSELFQNYSGPEVASYLKHSLKQTRRVGLLVNYSETHDNNRLAVEGRAWALLRNRLCALVSVSGGFGFTCGVEWLATEKINVHGSAGLAWNNAENLVPELARLSQLLAEHPCFFDGAQLTPLSPPDSPVYALRRTSEEGKDTMLVLVNTDVEKARAVALQAEFVPEPRSDTQAAPSEAPSAEQKVQAAKAKLLSFQSPGLSVPVDLLGQVAPDMKQQADGKILFTLAPGAAYCLASNPTPIGLHGDAYRRARTQAAWGLAALSHLLPAESLDGFDWRALAAAVDRSPAEFLAAISSGGARTFLSAASVGTNSPARPQDAYPRVVRWSLLDVRRVTLVPPQHWLLIQDAAPFRATLSSSRGGLTQNVESIPVRDGHIACFIPRQTAADATLRLERYAEKDRHVQAPIRFLAPSPACPPRRATPALGLRPADLVLLTNGRGGMARICVDLGRVNSKYDCVLGANLHPTLPVDRYVLAKRVRVWLNADGFISPLDFRSLDSFEPGPPAAWHFIASAGDGRTVEIQLTADMLEGRNTTVFRFERPSESQATGKQCPPEADVRLTVRLDLEDRSFHGETKRNGGAEYHFSTHVHPLAPPAAGPPGAKVGFAFTPAADRQLRVFANSGSYHPEPEWSENIPHPVEQTRGQVGSGDAFSPGWFDLPLPKGASVTLVVTADPADPDAEQLESFRFRVRTPQSKAAFAETDAYGQQLLRAVRAFVVQRDSGKTIIAGYPWFLDWGRDSFICARGLLAAGLVDEVRQLLLTFARFEKDGTLPNSIFGDDASNRDTSDAPLWFGLVCDELAHLTGTGFYQTKVGSAGATIADTLWDIAIHYANGTPNGIRMDPASGLIWSPSHFTWMDTNYPACTPREGYPIEIQALWVLLLRQLERIGGRTERKGWDNLADKALASLDQLFWLEDRGYYADVLLAQPGQPAVGALASDALRSNCLVRVSLLPLDVLRARRTVQAALRYLVVPGALRSLAPLPVTVPLPVHGNDGRVLNNPSEPYWGTYEGDEDTRRKPAYHNGTAWTWTFPLFCEALARAWQFAPEAVAAAKAYLGSTSQLMAEGCLGQLPEITDGDAPHTQRGCDAQAWGATETLRVWWLLQDAESGKRAG